VYTILYFTYCYINPPSDAAHLGMEQVASSMANVGLQGHKS
jgi:hypothetical protein